MASFKPRIKRLALVIITVLILYRVLQKVSKSPRYFPEIGSETSSVHEACVCPTAPINSFASIDESVNLESSTVNIAVPGTSVNVLPDTVRPVTTINVTATPDFSYKYDSPPWRYNPTLHSNTYALSEYQCKIAFPQLFREIDRAAAYQAKKIIKINEKDLGQASHMDQTNRAPPKVMIVDKQMFILNAKVWYKGRFEQRTIPLLHALHRAIISSQEDIPNVIFTLTTDDLVAPDGSGPPIWALSRMATEEMKWIMPDFGFWSWPDPLMGSYQSIRREINDTELPFAQKKKQVVWRGWLQSNPMRKKLMEVTRNKPWADVDETYYHDHHIKAPSWSSLLTISEQCQYQFVVQTEGFSYSSRGVYLLNCNSVYIAPDPIWLQPHTHLLIASGINQNYVRVKSDFSDLEAKVKELLAEPKRAEAIAKRSAALFRDKYLTPAADACYWRHMLRQWASVSEAPEIWEAGNGDWGKPKGKGRYIRGVAFEDWASHMSEVAGSNCGWFAWLMGRC